MYADVLFFYGPIVPKIKAILFYSTLLRPPPQTRRSTRDTSATSSRRRHRMCLGHTRSPRVVNLRTNFGTPPSGGK